MGIRAALFDLDGTLLDSMGMWADIDRHFLSRRGVDVPPDYPQAVAVMRVHEAAVYTKARFSLKDDPDDIQNEWLDMARHEYRCTIPLKSFAREYLRFLKEHGLSVGIVTSQNKDMFMPALERCGVLELIDAYTCASEAARGKAYPDVYLLAADKLHVPPQECAMYDDMPQAILGARNAGMYTVGVYDEYGIAHRRELTLAADRCTEGFDEELRAQPPLFAI